MKQLTKERFIKTRKDLLSALIKAKSGSTEVKVPAQYIGNAVSLLTDAEEAALGAWVSVADRLPAAMRHDGYTGEDEPDESADVLAWFNNGAILARYYGNRDAWYAVGQNWRIYPTHWMRIEGPNNQ